MERCACKYSIGTLLARPNFSRGLLAPCCTQDSRLPVPSARDGFYSDDSIRADASGELVARDVAPRPGGWAIHDILCRATEVIRARDNTIYGLLEDQARL